MRERVLTERAKEMRTHANEPETRSWLALRAKRFSGVKFRRQKVVGPYIVDFACRDPMVVIELDGDSHAERIEADATRTAYLRGQGYEVIRFTNTDIMTNLEGVLNTLAARLAQSPLPTLSLEGERALSAASLSPSGERGQSA
jgi:very-short-patch-repair endonuclease